MAGISPRWYYWPCERASVWEDRSKPSLDEEDKEGPAEGDRGMVEGLESIGEYVPR